MCLGCYRNRRRYRPTKSRHEVPLGLRSHPGAAPAPGESQRAAFAPAGEYLLYAVHRLPDLARKPQSAGLWGAAPSRTSMTPPLLSAPPPAWPTSLARPSDSVKQIRFQCKLLAESDLSG